MYIGRKFYAAYTLSIFVNALLQWLEFGVVSAACTSSLSCSLMNVVPLSAPFQMLLVSSLAVVPSLLVFNFADDAPENDEKKVNSGVLILLRALMGMQCGFWLLSVGGYIFYAQFAGSALYYVKASFCGVSSVLAFVCIFFFERHPREKKKIKRRVGNTLTYLYAPTKSFLFSLLLTT